jgi:UDP-2-acetamido-3-amino-2,3-dideoxy-glucuronate N-acetyltransferase
VTSPAVLIELPEFVDERGSLVVAEHLKQLPFSVERIFFVSGVPQGDKRGIHAHRQCHQVLICLAGSVKALVDDGRESEVVFLDRSNLALHMPPLTWGTQFDYSADAVLLVLTSHGYDAGDYIHDYDEFLQLATDAR